MRVGTLTASFFIFGIVLLLAWPFVLGPTPPDDATRSQLAQYGVRTLLYFFVTCTAFLASAVCAVILMRRNREMYREKLRENVEELIEGTLHDHQKRKQ